MQLSSAAVEKAWYWPLNVWQLAPPAGHYRLSISYHTAMNRSLPDLSLANVSFHMPDLKHGMRCLPSFRT